MHPEDARELAKWSRPYERYPPLDEQAVRSLFRTYQDTKKTDAVKRRARDRIVYGHARLVFAGAKIYAGKGLPVADLVQEGFIGCMRACEKFDLARHVRFGTYATSMVRQAMQRALHDRGLDLPFPVPPYVHAQIAVIRRALYELRRITGEWPGDDMVLAYVRQCQTKQATRIKPHHISAVRQYLHRRFMSLQSPVGDEGNADDRTYEDLIPRSGLGPEDQAILLQELERDPKLAMRCGLSPVTGGL